jgi:DNA-binding response OmpR family regulator
MSVAGGEGAIWQDKQTDEFYRGDKPLRALTPIHARILQYLSENPYVRLTYGEIIFNCWPHDKREEVTNEALAQQIRGLRQAIESNPSRPCYIVNWRGHPEGGYQFFPEGKPAG